jgi:hypothetical protein
MTEKWKTGGKRWWNETRGYLCDSAVREARDRASNALRRDKREMGMSTRRDRRVYETGWMEEREKRGVKGVDDGGEVKG